MKLLLSLTIISTAVAGETVLYDVDFSKSSAQLGQSILVGGEGYPGRTRCSAIRFGEAKIGWLPGNAPLTAAILRPTTIVGSGPTGYGQLEFQLGWQIYAFRKHRIELKCRLVDWQSFGYFDSLSIMTDGGVTYSLVFPDGPNALLTTNVLKKDTPMGERVVQENSELPNLRLVHGPIDLVWESDATAGTTTLTCNGRTFAKSGLAVTSYALRNWQRVPGPLSIRINYQSDLDDPGLAVESFRLIGSDYDGPLYDADPNRNFSWEGDLVSVPLTIPAQGKWQPEFSIDGATWSSFGVPVDRSFPIQRVVFGTKLASKMMFRMKNAEE